MDDFRLSVGRIIHVTGNDNTCLAAIVTQVRDDLPDTFNATVFAATGPVSEAARRITLRTAGRGQGWHDPRSHS